MVNDKRINIRLSSKDKEIIFDYCSKNNVKVSELLRKCTLNYIRENENKYWLVRIYEVLY